MPAAWWRSEEGPLWRQPVSLCLMGAASYQTSLATFWNPSKSLAKMHANTSIWVLPSEPQPGLQIVHPTCPLLAASSTAGLDSDAYSDMPAAPVPAINYTLSRRWSHMSPHPLFIFCRPLTLPCCSPFDSLASILDTCHASHW
ncbi:hypothetical protein BU16DRAFT_78148 [Lophium mytilinum]|uniref:Uncharacterized protein n=1 Tax=Lophium mytilinum TaxID=390894 RepID=A0A6A6QMM9_9PEZI|nr:hypothetical protein BU16DRAFT_78148 [Lophium mytilinum]